MSMLNGTNSPNDAASGASGASTEEIQSPQTIYIAGAGIAGMTLALSLAKHDFNIVVLEKTDHPTTQGAGLQISPNARRVLDDLGLDEAMKKYGFATDAIDIYPFKSQHPLVSLEMGDAIEQQFHAPYCVIHRADLFKLLYQACQKHANIQFFFDVKTFDMENHAKGLSISFELPGGECINDLAYAFIGADGVHSHTRRNILGGPDAVYSGFVAWRALIPASMMHEQLNLSHTSLMWGPNFHAIAYPHPDRHVLNIALFSKEKQSDQTRVQAVNSPSLSRAGINCPRLQDIFTAAEGSWTKWPLNAVQTNVWHKGPIGLIGDAAHAMLPYQAQGAAMAIEDAGILGYLLAHEKDATTALEKYQKLRQSRVAKVVKTSAANGSIYHMTWPFSLARNLVVSAQGPRGHFKRLAWIYEYDPLADVSYLKKRS